VQRLLGRHMRQVREGSATTREYELVPIIVFLGSKKWQRVYENLFWLYGRWAPALGPLNSRSCLRLASDTDAGLVTAFCQATG